MRTELLLSQLNDYGKEVHLLCQTIAQKKILKEDVSELVTKKIFIENKIVPLKEQLKKQEQVYDEVFKRVINKCLPIDVKTEVYNLTEKALRGEIDIKKIREIQYTAYNQSDLDIISSKYPQLMKSVSKMIESNNKQKVEARKLFATLNTRLTPDEQHLVKEVKEFLSNIINT